MRVCTQIALGSPHGRGKPGPYADIGEASPALQHGSTLRIAQGFHGADATGLPGGQEGGEERGQQGHSHDQS